MEYYLAIEKRKNNLDKFFELFSKQPVVTIKELKSKVSKSSFYKIVLKKIFDINELLKYFDPNLSFCEPSFYKDQNENIYQAFKRNPNIEIIDHKDFYILKVCANGREKGS